MKFEKRIQTILSGEIRYEGLKAVRMAGGENLDLYSCRRKYWQMTAPKMAGFSRFPWVEICTWVDIRSSLAALTWS